MGRPFSVIAISLLFGLTAGSALASGEGMTVELADSQRVGLRGSAANVIVSDPAVADVAMVDSHSLLVIGRGYGATRVVVLDAVGRTLFDRRVTVVAANDGRVTVYRGAVASDFSCAQRCQTIAGAKDASTAGAAAAPAAAPTATP
ncbi:MAG: pilus assembly protein N-terminal domain-containing protein [Caulobacteraceae bacterium]|nr:pilus assembly protein N-terminal domain-containing protein [Caulobacteraceae bacterium]